MLQQYYTIIGCRYEANANIASGNPILNQCGLTRERQRQYRRWETNVGPIYSCCLGNLDIHLVLLSPCTPIYTFSHFSFFIFIMFRPIVWSKFVSQAIRGGRRSKYSFFSVYTPFIDIDFLLLVYLFIISYYTSLIFFVVLQGDPGELSHVLHFAPFCRDER